MRRFFVPPFFAFDARVHSLDEVNEEWDESVKQQHLENRRRMLEQIRHEYGSDRFDDRVKNFIDVGDSPMSIVSYHNQFYRQARDAFVIGAYYPALVGACALGERMLNHLVIDLRESFRSKATYKSVYRKDSFDNWKQAIDALVDWGVFEPGVAADFEMLGSLRNRSVHFDSQTYTTAREDALNALHYLKKIIGGQFSAFGTQRWFIRGTKGACFLREGAESDPFVRTFYIPQCPLVGYRYAVARLLGGAALLCDYEKYENSSVSDDEFCRLFNERPFAEIVPTELPPSAGVMVWYLAGGQAIRVSLKRTEDGQGFLVTPH